MSRFDEILNDLKKVIYPNFEITYFDPYRKHFYIKTKLENLLDAAKFLLSIDARIVHVTASDMGFNGIKIMHFYSLEHLEPHAHLIIYAYTERDSPKAPSLAQLTYQVHWAERETMELLGVEFQGHPDPRHLFLPFEWPNPVESSSEYVKGKFRNVVLPIGPYHPSMIEGGFFKIVVDGEEILDVDIKVGLSHRGIMRLAENRTLHRDVFLIGRICGICSIPHQFAFVNTIEKILRMQVPERAEYIRILMAELNRIHSHLLWLGVSGDLIGFKSLLMWAWKIREPVQDCTELLSGNRVHADAIIIGGVRFDVSSTQIEKVEKKLYDVKKEVNSLMELIYSHSIVRKRTEDIGKLLLPKAKEAGAVGPTARASGWKIDVRRDSPYSFYDESHLTWDVITDDGCDVFSRVLVRVKEILVSIDICLQCLDMLKKIGGQVVNRDIPLSFNGEALSKVEAPRGELFYYVHLRDSSIPHTVRIRTPSYRNIPTLKFMLPGYKLSDAPIIIGSVDPCFSCTDRVIIIDKKKSEERILNYEEFKNIFLKEGSKCI
ncbi:MAG: NADH-quinone oxidoreductase subunit C [Candidatus Methanomethylicia archaeon]|nr:NADH-quinone oxidoreductase subunit C [Candidatus Methanomethylicia archaeon]